MNNIKIPTNVGGNFTEVAKRAKETATEKLNSEFDFNGVKCVVSRETNLEALARDYSNSWTMGWKEVGPNCVDQYDDATQKEFETKARIAEEKHEKEMEVYRKKEEEERKLFNKKIAGVSVEWVDQAVYQKYKDLNTDPYGSCIMEYAEGWAKLMQLQMKAGKTLSECAESTSFEMGFMGITGFMYGAAVQTLSVNWKYGEDLRKWHNSKFKHEGEGVVNPAVISIGKK